MAWNEPGGGNRDPWNNKGGDQGPPDLDEVVRNLQNKLGDIFGGKKRGGNGGNSGGGDSSSGGGAGLIVVLVLAAVIVFSAIDSFYTIQPAERGVILRFGAYSSVTGPGPHFKLPWIDRVEVVNVDDVKEFVQRSQMLTNGENIADVTLKVQFRIQDVADFLFQDATPGRTIHGATESALREVVGKSSLDDVIKDNRSGIALEVQRGTQELLDLYRTGLIVTNVNIQRADVPEAVQDAFADAVKAREDKEKVQNQAEAYANDVIPRARGAAARLIEDAKAHKAKVVAEADGESQRFLALLTEYEKAPGVTRERLYLETMQEVLRNTGKVVLDVKEGSNLTYLPLDRMIKPGSSAGLSSVDSQRSATSSNADRFTTPPTTGSRTNFTRERGVR